MPKGLPVVIFSSLWNDVNIHTYVFKFSLNNYLVHRTYKYLIIEWFYSEILNHSPFCRSVFSYYISKIHCCRCYVVYFILIFISNIWFFALTTQWLPSWLPHFHGWNIITFVLPIESNDVSKQPTLQPQKKLFHLWKKALFLICYKCCLYCKNIDQSKTMIWVIIFHFRIWWLKRADK